MGLLREALREAERKRRASLMFSRYSRMALVLLYARQKVEQVVDVDIQAVAQRDEGE